MTDNIEIKKGKKTKESGPKKKISFSMNFDQKENIAASPNLEKIVNDTREQIAARLEKSVKAQPVNDHMKGKYNKSKVVFSSEQNKPNFDGVDVKPWKRLRDEEQREIAQIDPYISAIISTRTSQGAACGLPSDSKFDKGCRIKELKPLKKEDFQNEDTYTHACKARAEEMKAIMSWLQSCGTRNQTILDYAFSDSDRTFKYCSLKQFIEAQIRNVLTFGRCATQIFRNKDGIPVMFRPAPVETIMSVKKGEPIHLGNGEDTAEQSEEDLALYNALTKRERPYIYVQKINGQNTNLFTEEEMKIWYWQKQALFDLNEYPLSPIELAIYMVYTHNQTLNYLRNQFVKGMGTKCILVLESTDPNVDIDEVDLENFKQQAQNFLTRTDNSSTIPVIGGAVKVNVVDFARGPKDMEFLQVEEHVIRSLCSSFQISPQEMGYGHLSIGQGGLTQSNKQEEMIRGEERGLRNILDLIFEGINEILCENFPEAKEKYQLTFVGIGTDSKDEVLQRGLVEVQTTATMSSLFADSEKTETIPIGGNVPLSSAFHQNVVRYMRYGEFMEKFFGEKDATKNPAYDFIIDPNMNQAYQQNKLMAAQAQQMQQQAQMQAMQPAMAQQGIPAEGQPQENNPTAQLADHMALPEKEEKSINIPVPGEKQAVKHMTLREKYEQLHKSKPVESYFDEWVRIH